MIGTSWPPRLQHRHVAAAQHAEAGLAAPASSSRSLPAKRIVAHAEQGEIVGDQPFEELDRLGDLVDRQRRRIGLQLRDHLVDAARASAASPARTAARRRAPAPAPARSRCGGAASSMRSTWMWMKLSRSSPFGRARVRRRAGELAGLAVALDAKDRMRDQPDLEAALGQLAHHRIDQERHVVVDDLDHRDRLRDDRRPTPAATRSGSSARPGLRVREERRGLARPAPRARPARSRRDPPARRGRTAARRSSPARRRACRAAAWLAASMQRAARCVPPRCPSTTGHRGCAS